MERPMDRGSRLGREGLARLGAEVRTARIDRGLTVDVAARAAGISNAEVSRIERALAPRAPVLVVARLAAIVGLDLSIRTFPGPSAIRDAGHAALLSDLHVCLHVTVRWGVEVPFPEPRDQRAWDAMVSGVGWRYGVEAETRPHDSQALLRRLAIKQRDGLVDGLILLLRDTRPVRAFLHEAGDSLRTMCPVAGAVALARLRGGGDPGGSAVIVLPRPSTIRSA